MQLLLDEDKLVEVAQAAERRGDYDAADGAWEVLREHHPQNMYGYVWPAMRLRNAREYALADALFEQGLARAASRSTLATQYAWSAFYRVDWDLALVRWKAAIKADPSNVDAYFGAAVTLLRMGQLDEAGAVLDGVPKEYSTAHQIAIGRAQILQARQDWGGALQIWERLQLEIPKNPLVIEGAGLCRINIQLKQQEAGPGERRATGVAVDRAEGADQKLMLRFTNLGFNCEFGLTQRRVGVEPISLLRWAAVQPSQLVQMLEARFAGLGEPENTQIYLEIYKEYYLKDSLYGLQLHTWIKEHEEEPEELLRKHSRILRRLRDLLLDGLDEGNQLLVYKVEDRSDEVEMRRIHAALHGFAPSNTLLWVQQADAANPPGSVQVLEPTLVRGYLSHLSPPPGRAFEDIPVEEWLQICRFTAAIHDSTC